MPFFIVHVGIIFAKIAKNNPQKIVHRVSGLSTASVGYAVHVCTLGMKEANIGEKNPNYPRIV